VSWIASQPGVTEVNGEELPFSLKAILSFILSSPYIPQESVKTYHTDCSRRQYVIAFDFLWDQPAEILEERIGRPESIALWFSARSELASPPQVRSNRMMFPRDLPHLNMVPDSEPSSLCLAREGLSSIYQRGGIPALLQRLSMWLRDAAAGRLDHDGWEPVPHFGFCSATLNIAWFQKIAYNSKKTVPGHSVGIAQLFVDKDVDEKVVIHAQLISRNNELEKIWLNAPDDVGIVKKPLAINSYWYMAWGKRSEASAQRRNKLISNLADLLAFAEEAGCKEQVQIFIDVICGDKSPERNTYYVLLIGEWRPNQLIQTIPGLASGDARKLEITGFHISIKAEGVKREIEYIFQLELRSEANSENLNKMSGFNRMPENVVLLGAGALGSKIAEHLVREGAGTLSIVDSDRFFPHNLSRHALTHKYLYFNKAKALKTFLLEINKVIDIHTHDVDVAKIPAGQFKEQIAGLKQGILIDCTADLPAMRRISQSDNVTRTVKVEIADNGQIGLLFYEGRRRNPRIDDLKALVPYLSIEISGISVWLNRVGDPIIDTGIGCASPSMVVSDSRVSVHAANFMTSISRIVRGEELPSGLGVAIANQQGHLDKWIWIEEPSLSTFNTKINGDRWDVRVRSSVVKAVTIWRDQSKPNEAGGYLYGSYDLSLKTIYVVWACEPVALEKTPVSIKLPIAGSSEEEIHMRHSSAGQLRLLGTWHSHPDSNSDRSTTDTSQFVNDTDAYAANPSPHLLMIVGEQDISISLGLPPLWKNKISV